MTFEQRPLVNNGEYFGVLRVVVVKKFDKPLVFHIAIIPTTETTIATEKPVTTLLLHKASVANLFYYNVYRMKCTFGWNFFFLNYYFLKIVWFSSFFVIPKQVFLCNYIFAQFPLTSFRYSCKFCASSSPSFIGVNTKALR